MICPRLGKRGRPGTEYFLQGPDAETRFSFCLKAVSALLEEPFHIDTNSRRKFVITTEGVHWCDLNPQVVPSDL